MDISSPDSASYNVICELVMVTYDEGPSLSPFVSRVVEEIRRFDGITHELTAMGSIIEGPWESVSALIDHLFRTFAPDYERLGITFRIDFRKSAGDGRIRGKISSVAEKLGN